MGKKKRLGKEEQLQQKSDCCPKFRVTALEGGIGRVEVTEIKGDRFLCVPQSRFPCTLPRLLRVSCILCPHSV